MHCSGSPCHSVFERAASSKTSWSMPGFLETTLSLVSFVDRTASQKLLHSRWPLLFPMQKRQRPFATRQRDALSWLHGLFHCSTLSQKPNNPPFNLSSWQGVLVDVASNSLHIAHGNGSRWSRVGIQPRPIKLVDQAMQHIKTRPQCRGKASGMPGGKPVPTSGAAYWSV